MPRQARLDAPGTLHHIIIRGIEKRRIFDDDQDRKAFLFKMGTLSRETGTAIYAWALLPNHVHLLLRSGPGGLPRFMRRLLTGYALGYNRRHKRWGHLFQNRYKSIVCEEDNYFQELVRYIHLNPVRAELVADLKGLNDYAWCGHGVLLGKQKADWQDRDYVLGWFGSKEREAREAYRKFIWAGMDQGRRPELVGGGLLRSQGGWSQVVSMRRHGEMEMADERVLGSGDFVEKILAEADEQVRLQFPPLEKEKKIRKLISEYCEKEEINWRELQSGSRRRPISVARAILAGQLVKEYGVPLAEAARHLGVTTSAVSKMIEGKGNSNSTNSTTSPNLRRPG
ncbi:MAG: transposase [Deltaproteobacteria bacterium]|nr:transposase [Deltaproteobacteria bacterium]